MSTSILKQTLLLILALLVSSCTTLSLNDSNNITWSNHHQTVTSLVNWELQGRLNIRQENKSDTLSFRWKQTDDDYVITLSGTLGLGSVVITGNTESVSIEKTGQPPITAESLEEVSRAYLGFELPAQELRYWVRGIPAPGRVNHFQLNSKQLLEYLEQTDNNQIAENLHYEHYQLNNQLSIPVSMPGEINLELKDYRLKFYRLKWQLKPT